MSDHTLEDKPDGERIPPPVIQSNGFVDPATAPEVGWPVTRLLIQGQTGKRKKWVLAISIDQAKLPWGSSKSSSGKVFNPITLMLHSHQGYQETRRRRFDHRRQFLGVLHNLVVAQERKQREQNLHHMPQTHSVACHLHNFLQARIIGMAIL